MTRTYGTAVVIVPPSPVWAPIQRIRQRHDRHYRRWMPHVTLLYPFRPREEWTADLLHGLRLACGRVPPFEVELAEFHTFQHRDSYTLWLAPEPSAHLVDLQGTLWQVTPDCDDTRRHAGGFTPHLSVGQARGQGRASALQAELQATWTPLRFRVSEVQLIWRDEPPDDIFRVERRVPLGQTE